MADLNALYEQYLGRAPDPSGLATWSGQDEASIIAGITGSQEYANRQASGGGGQVQDINLGGPITPNILYNNNGGVSPSTATDINALYQQYLGRNVDPSGAATWAGQSPEAIIAGIKGSPEYQASHGGSTSAGGGNAQDLANQVFNLYATNQNYDQQLNQLNSLAATDPQAFYKARIGLLGKQMGWQIGQNTGDRNSVYQNELNSLIPGALASGMTQNQINNLIGQNTASASQQNQARIAADAASGAGKGWVNQNIPGGYGTLAAAAALVAAPYLAPELFGSVEAMGPTYAELGYTPAATSSIGTAATLTPGTDLYELMQSYPNMSVDQLQSIMEINWGADPQLAYDAANLANSGYNAATIDQLLQYGYSAKELAPLGLEFLGPTLSTAASSGLSASQLANLLKSGSAAAKSLIGSSGKTSGINPSLLSSLGQLAQGQSGYGMEIPGIVRTNTNPFYNTPQVALQTPQKTEMSTLSDLLRQGKSSWQT